MKPNRNSIRKPKRDERQKVNKGQHSRKNYWQSLREKWRIVHYNAKLIMGNEVTSCKTK
jgi:hypothetical protein